VKLSGHRCEPVPSTLQIQLIDLIHFYAHWRMAFDRDNRAGKKEWRSRITSFVVEDWMGVTWYSPRQHEAEHNQDFSRAR